MSRHRDIRNINIENELDDEAIDDGEEYDMTPEEEAQMNDALEQVRNVVGDEYDCGISDKDLKKALWDRFFDVHQGVNWVFEEKDRRAQARDRKGKDLPPLPPDAGASSPTYLHANYQGGERPRIPLIVLAQQQYRENAGDDSQSSIQQDVSAGYRLSTISERTERTEPSPAWPLRKQAATPSPLHVPRPASETPSTSYGEVVEGRDVTTIDPNLIPLSPSDSAVYRLSKYEPPPSMPSSGTRTVEPSPPNPPSVSLPPLENIPDIPDFSSIPSRQPTESAPPKQSKLAALASSRASKISAAKSDASSSSTTILSGSIRTFPALRPNSQSIRPPSSTAPSQGAEGAPLSPESSIHSSVINRAIDAAIALETLDKSTTQKPSPIVNDPPARTPTQSPRMIPPPVENKSSTSRPPSKLALLAQAKAKAGSSMVPSAAESLVKLSTKKALALLPKDHTEILTPTANGPTATTAITTSYQSLFSLTDPSRPHVVPALRVVPFEATRSADSGDAKQSKLAMKIRKAQEKQTQLSPVEPVAATPIVSPLFKGKSSQARASPSAFGSLLVHETQETAKDKPHRRHKEKKQRASGGVDGEEVEDAHRSRRKHYLSPVPELAMPFGFAFNEPSPDDIVFNARKGTSLGKVSESSRHSVKSRSSVDVA
ncbi:hypothetical protein BDN71DRAFT_1506483 [Pleurotus eryngii]|uniref:HBS1-like protein N-terminal domain-containing protein n=1 Tax=Pleurotus eryngii TaxID=5323 RepID=A0A9P6D8Y2_PLEER|nr:hypothetical protein BDN71DRAFT_1506483 [Pleurotus eryngii]